MWKDPISERSDLGDIGADIGSNIGSDIVSDIGSGIRWYDIKPHIVFYNKNYVGSEILMMALLMQTQDQDM